jgi:Hemerythrin HHE cation binding domain
MADPQTEPTGTPSPRESLGQCHRCIAGMMDRLETLAGELVANARGPERAERARALVADIDEALGVHLVDEEAEVFPAVLAAAESPARRAQAFELVSSLLVEHREIAELWHALRIALLAIGSGVEVAFPGGTAADFVARFRSHLARENLELDDLMARVGTERSREMGTAMANRHEDACLRARNCPLGKP